MSFPKPNKYDPVLGDPNSWHVDEDYGVSLFRPTDAAVLNDAALLTYEGKAVPVIFATPSRALATLQKAMRINDKKNIPLPYCSVQRMNPVLDQFRYAHVYFRKVQYTDDRNAVKQTQCPIPFSVEYQISLWDNRKYRLAALVEDYLSRFWPMMRLEVDYGDPYGVMGCHVSLSGSEDVSNLEPGNDEDITLRFVVRILVEGWQVLGVKRVPTVRSNVVAFYVDDQLAEIATYPNSSDGG